MSLLSLGMILDSSVFVMFVGITVAIIITELRMKDTKLRRHEYVGKILYFGSIVTVIFLTGSIVCDLLLPQSGFPTMKIIILPFFFFAIASTWGNVHRKNKWVISRPERIFGFNVLSNQKN